MYYRLILSTVSLDNDYRSLEAIGRATKEMREATFIKRLLAKDEHAAQLIKHRRALQDAAARFQVGHWTFLSHVWQ